MAKWFASWFDTPYYHKLYKNRDFGEAKNFVEQLVTELNIPIDARVLDLCCGRGRHSVQLNDLGFDVLGMDLSGQSIAFAKQFENKNLEFKEGDMRQEYAIGEFDVIFNLFTSFGYFDQLEENLQVLNAIRSYMKPNGVLLIDFLNASKIEQNLPVTEEISSEGINFKIKKSIENGFILKKISFTDAGRNFEFEEKVSAFKLTDFEKMLDQTGFKIEGAYGEYDLSQFSEHASSRLILKAELK